MLIIGLIFVLTLKVSLKLSDILGLTYTFDKFSILIIATFLAGVLSLVLKMRIKTVEVLTWSWEKTKRVLTHPVYLIMFVWLLFVGLYLGIKNWIVVGMTVGMVTSLFFGLYSVLFFMLLIPIIVRPTYSKLIEIRVIPNQGIWRTAQYAIQIGFAIALFFIITLPFIASFLGDSWDGNLEYALVDSLLLGLMSGIFFGGAACIQHFVLRFLLFLKGYIPWNLAYFLDYAAGHILLRKVGGGYIFIHRLLLEYFASLEEEGIEHG